MKDNVSFSMLPTQVREEFFNKLNELGMAKKAKKTPENPTKESGEGAGRS
jgi:hypothetical protein